VTNAYCEALSTLRAAPSHYLKQVGDQWQTPDLLFWGINAIFGPLLLDLFADDINAKCPAWYTAEDNALTQDWSGRLAELGGAAFANPPYSRSQYHEKQAITGMTHIMNYTAEQREKGGRYIYLVKSATSETWWPEDADHIMFIRGRIGFDLPAWFVPADEKQKPTSAFFAGAIAVFDKTWRGECFSYIDRVELEAKGRASMALAQFAVGQVSQAKDVDPTPAAKPVAEPVVESRIWPLEVNLAFGQVEGAADLGESQQNRLKAHINHLWLERTPKDEILILAAGMVNELSGEAA
jgi:phage N-6-adenine-methyltransferase